jgi:hypothetical protein
MNRTIILTRIREIKKRGFLHSVDFPTGINSLNKEALLKVFESLVEKEEKAKAQANEREREREHQEKVNKAFGVPCLDVELENPHDWDSLYGLLQYVPRVFSDMILLAQDLLRCQKNFARWLRIKDNVGKHVLGNGEVVTDLDARLAFDLFRGEFERLKCPYFSFDITQDRAVARALEARGYKVEKIDG